MTGILRMGFLFVLRRDRTCDEGLQAAFKSAARQHYATSTAQTLETDVSPDANDTPLVATARVYLA